MDDLDFSCEGLHSMMFNWSQDTRAVESWNRKYLAIGDIKGIRLYEKRDQDFIFQATIDKAVNLRTEFYINANGKLVTIGDSFSAVQSEIIEIYNEKGERVRSIGAKNVLSDIEIEKVRSKYESAGECAPDQPWICWSVQPYLEDDVLLITTALGHGVDINIESGEITRTESREICEDLSTTDATTD